MIFDLIAYACLATLIVDFISTIDINDYIPKKPFKCDMCFGYWYSVLPLVIEYDLKGFIYAGVVGVLANLIYKIQNRI